MFGFAKYIIRMKIMGNYPDPMVVERVCSLEHPFLIPAIVILSLLTRVALALVVWCNRWRFLYTRKRKHLVIG